MKHLLLLSTIRSPYGSHIAPQAESGLFDAKNKKLDHKSVPNSLLSKLIDQSSGLITNS
jgi:hypothetical protein